MSAAIRDNDITNNKEDDDSNNDGGCGIRSSKDASVNPGQQQGGSGDGGKEGSTATASSSSITSKIATIDDDDNDRQADNNNSPPPPPPPSSRGGPRQSPPKKRPRNEGEESPDTTAVATVAIIPNNVVRHTVPPQQKNIIVAAVAVAACGRCAFCKMPRCERCSRCRRSREVRHGGGGVHDQEDDEDEMGTGGGLCCIRKMCSNIPIEFRPRPPHDPDCPWEGWDIAFDDPRALGGSGDPSSPVRQCTRRPRDLFSAGLRATSPDGRAFRSLECAIAHEFRNVDGVGAGDVVDAVEAVEKFGAIVGSPRRSSGVDHFLVGKDYCAEFTVVNNDRGGVPNAFNTVVLFGKIAACMRRQRQQRPSSLPSSPQISPVETTSEEDDVFIVQFDRDALSIARGIMGTTPPSPPPGIIPPIQLVTSETAWGGCISHERRTCRRRNPATSAIINADQATPVETWVAPDARWEETVQGPDGIRVPRLTVFARGYKFVFEVRRQHDGCGGGKQRQRQRLCGVFASCTSTGDDDDDNDREINLKPGELIDLGPYSPLLPEDERPLPAFLVKNYIHGSRPGRWAVLSGLRDDAVCDITDDRTGEPHAMASERVLPYVRRRRRRRCSGHGDGKGGRPSRPTAHLRPDHAGVVHLLFGVAYEGNWGEYEEGMRSLVPMFCGGAVEVVLSRGGGGDGRDDDDVMGRSEEKRISATATAERKISRAIGAFRAKDIAACNHQLARMFDRPSSDSSTTTTTPTPGDDGEFPSLPTIERSREVLKFLEKRMRKLLEMFRDARSRSVGGGGGDNRGDLDEKERILVSTLDHSRRLSRVLDDRRPL